MDRLRPDANMKPVVKTRPFFAFSVSHDFQGTRFARTSGTGIEPPQILLKASGGPSPSRIQEITGGVFERNTFAEPAIQMLRSLRESFQSKGLRGRFDALFRHEDSWLFDSMEWVLSQDETLRREVLHQPEYSIAIPLSEPKGPQGRLLVPLRLGYLLYQAQNDTEMLERYEHEARSISPGCYRLAVQVSQHLKEAEEWYADVLEFFFYEPWVLGDNGPGRTILEQLEKVFPGASAIGSFHLKVDACGAPDAYASEDSSDQLIANVFHECNDFGRHLLETMSGEEKQALLTGTGLQLRAIAGRENEICQLQDWRNVYESGIIRKEKTIRFDIGNPVASIPELALHELTHAAYASVRPALRIVHDGALALPVIVRCLDHTLEEGVAEFFSNQALNELYRSYAPIRTYRQLRFAQLQSNPNDPHLAGLSIFRQHHKSGSFLNSSDFLECAEAADFNLLHLLRSWGEQELPRASIESSVAAVPAMQIAIGDKPEMLSMEFDLHWYDIALGADLKRETLVQ